MRTIPVLTLGRARPYSQKPGPTPNPPSHPHFWIAVTRSPLLRARLQGLRSKKQTTPDTPPHTRPEYRRFLLRPRSGKLTPAQMQREGDVHKTNRGSKTAGRSREKRLSLPLPSHRGPRILRVGARGASRRVLPPHGGPAAFALTSWKPGNQETWKPASLTPLSQSLVPPFSPHASLPLGAGPDPAVLIGQIAGGVGRSCERYSAFRSGSFNIGAGLTEGLNS